MVPALAISGLEKTYSNGVEAVSGIDLEVQEGDFFALLGRNGAGKSTVIGIICSLVNKSAGGVEIFGTDIDQNFPLAKSLLGVVPQEINFSLFEYPLQILINQAGYYGIPRHQAQPRAEELLKKLDLWEKRFDATRMLSGGMKRRLMIARAMVHTPRLLILDEPTAGVDVELRHLIWNLLREFNQNGTTIILTTHYLEEAEKLCRNIAIIDSGKLIEHTSMKALLKRLNTETMILELGQPLEGLPPVDGIVLRLLDNTTMEVDIDSKMGIGEVITRLNNSQIEVTGIRNKTNRLEQLFLCLLDNHRNGRAN